MIVPFKYFKLHRSALRGIFFFISRDPSYFEYVDKIGQHFFGLPAPQRPQGMFSGLLDSIFSAMNEDDSEEGETNNSVQMDLD